MKNWSLINKKKKRGFFEAVAQFGSIWLLLLWENCVVILIKKDFLFFVIEEFHLPTTWFHHPPKKGTNEEKLKPVLLNWYKVRLFCFLLWKKENSLFVYCDWLNGGSVLGRNWIQILTNLTRHELLLDKMARASRWATFIYFAIINWIVLGADNENVTLALFLRQVRPCFTQPSLSFFFKKELAPELFFSRKSPRFEKQDKNSPTKRGQDPSGLGGLRSCVQMQIQDPSVSLRQPASIPQRADRQSGAPAHPNKKKQ